jgi:predicted phosphodiesterase
MFNKYIDKDEWDVALVDIQNALNVLKDQTYTIKGNMDNFKRTQESAVDEMVNESIDAKMKDYSRVMHAFKKFFNQDELEKILDTKVD